MKHMKSVRLFSVLVALCLLLGSIAFAADTAPAPIRPEDDFYAAVNADWLKTETLPAHLISRNSFDDLTQEVDNLLMADFAQMLAGEKQPTTPALAEFVKFYRLAGDYETRNAQAATPLKPYLERIDALTSLADYDAVLKDWLLDGMPTPFSFYVMADMKDAQQHAFYAGAPSLFLPDKSYYGTETGTQLLGIFEQTITQLLTMADYTPEQAAQIAKDALAFDLLLSPYVKSAQEAADVTAMYNPKPLEAVAAYSSTLHLGDLVTSLVGTAPKEVIVADPQYFEALDTLLTAENFPLYKNWMTACTVYSLASYLSEDLNATASSYGMIMTGQTELDTPEKLAYQLASSTYSMVIGDYYGHTYFGQQAKDDVTAMVQSLTDVYVQRLGKADWLTEETRQAAIRKLDTMALQIGYPDKIDPIYEKLVVTEKENGGSLLSNIMVFSRISMEHIFSKYGQPVDRSEWITSANTVNAFYSPLTNTIVFPAAILQAPFYSADASKSQNLGGIGAVIAHEITHAFDNNGAQFDEFGNMENWWTEADAAAFADRTAAMVALFDGAEFAGSAVNGTLTVSENIADAGGLSCALEVTNNLPDKDLNAFFESWATVWRMLATPEYEQLLLSVDVHAPNKLRVNVQLKNSEAFQQTYGIKDGDGMYLPAENRVAIW